LAADQRYCLECGERRAHMSSVLLGGPPLMTPTQPPQPPGAPEGAGSKGGWRRDSTVAVIAGVGVLLLAMGVGVLIGRSGGSSQHSAAPPQVISVAPTGGGAGAAAGTAAGGGAGSVSDEWPAGTNGYTVQLQTLPVPGTSASAVAAAKSTAGAKGAKSVGVLKSNDFKSLTAGHYVIYSGVYHTKAEASKALAALKKSFPGASVIAVSSGGASAAPAASGGGGSGPAKPPPPSSLSHPAGPSVLKNLREGSGKNYEQKSKELPNVVTTG
jgi:hypothetical protein